MTTDELKAAENRIRSLIANDFSEAIVGFHYEHCDTHAEQFAAVDNDWETLGRAYLSSLAADEQQADRIATLERERDEARAAYIELCDALRSANSYWFECLELEDKPEWRKGGGS